MPIRERNDSKLPCGRGRLELRHLTSEYHRAIVVVRPDAALSSRCVETHVRHQHAERFVKQVRGDDAHLASYLRVEEHELEAR